MYRVSLVSLVRALAREHDVPTPPTAAPSAITARSWPRFMASYDGQHARRATGEAVIRRYARADNQLRRNLRRHSSVRGRECPLVRQLGDPFISRTIAVRCLRLDANQNGLRAGLRRLHRRRELERVTRHHAIVVI